MRPSWGCLGLPWASLGGPLGPLLGHSEASCWAVSGLLGRLGTPLSGPSGGSLAAFLEPSSGPLRLSWAPPGALLGQLEALLGPSLGHPGDLFEPS